MTGPQHRKHVRDLLLVYRRQHNLTTKELAVRMGVSYPTMRDTMILRRDTKTYELARIGLAGEANVK